MSLPGTWARRRGVACCACACLFLVLAAGCRSARSASSVQIQGNTPGQISLVAAEVFRENGYKVVQLQPTGLIAEKQGSRMNDIAYGDWLGDSPVWVRVELSIRQISETICGVQCRAYIVRDYGAASEEQLKLSHLQSGPCKKILDEVAARLQKRSRPAADPY